jgi:sugar phosphate isomerase/epimerase
MAAGAGGAVMQLALPGRPHLTYCTNIHAGETWPEIAASLERHLPTIKERVSPDAPMGLGLRLSAVAAQELADPSAREQLKHFLAAGDFYVFTVNAFPYGSFHGRRVKEQVYAPDWRSPERVAYTNLVADVLADVAPAGFETSISTVPGAFRASVAGRNDIDAIANGLVRAAAYLFHLATTQGRTIILALEPEPACFLETTEEAVHFFEEHLFSLPARQLFHSLTAVGGERAEGALRRHLGLCFDACHAAVEFEDVRASLEKVREAGIRVAKIQLSSAIKVPVIGPESESRLAAFDDGVYLHQTVETRDGRLTRHTDLPDALAALRRGEAGGEWRVHCHVPVFLEGFGALRSTQDTLRDVLRLCRERDVSPHLEVETYTWNVLPTELRNGDIATNIARELAWVRSELGV